VTEPERISPEEAHKKLKAGTAILVCAYENEDRFEAMHLEGAISLKEFYSKLQSLPKEQEIVFY